MDESTSQTTELDDKLTREMERVEQLRESLSRSNQMTDNMLGILTSFENRLRKLEDTITPVYQETGNLQRRHENIEKTLTALDHVIGFFHVAEEVEPVIREGPSSGLQNYLECMEKLQRAQQYFQVNKYIRDSPEMSSVKTLYDSGKSSLEREFRNLLTRHSKPVPAVVLLDAMTLDEELPNEEPQKIEHLPERIQIELSEIATWLQNCDDKTDTGSKPYIQVYGSVRSAILVKSLQCLRDHLKTGSKDSATNIPMSHSPALASKLRSSVKDTPSRKALKRMMFVHKASTKLETLVGSPLAKHYDNTGMKRAGPAGTEAREEGSDIDIDFYITGVAALLKLLQSEAALMEGIIPQKEQRTVFDKLIQPALVSIIKEGEQIVSSIKRAVLRHDHSAVLAVFPVLKHLRTIKPEFDVVLEGCQAPTRSKLATLISTLDQNGAKALEEFIDSIRNDPDKASNMPRDGTVHELTSNTIIFLEHLLDYADTAGAMLLTQDPAAVASKQTTQQTRKKVAEFITKVLSSLGLNLTNKAETYNDVTLQSIFMLNNYNYILKSIKSTELAGLVGVTEANIQRKYEDLVREQKRLYSRSWSRVMHYILEAHRPVSHHTSSHEGKLKDKERQAIKEKFTGFNKEMDDLSRIQKGYAIPDAELRETLRQDNKDFVLPKYQMFLDKYQNCNFTKNTDKYIKYQVADVAGLIDQFFDSAA